MTQQLTKADESQERFYDALRDRVRIQNTAYSIQGFRSDLDFSVSLG